MVSVQQVTELVAQLGGLAILAGTLAAVGAFVYRWYVHEELPRGLALLVGLSGVAVYLNTTGALEQVIGGSSAPTETQVALFNIAAFLVGAGGATLGDWAGDWFGSEVFLGEHVGAVENDVGRFVQSVGRVIAVELPQEIDDVVGYDPVPEATRESLAGKTFLFPRRLTVDELRERLVSRLTSDYGVGHVDIELTDDGSVEYLALGSRAAGIGPTLPPATNAVAIRADPAFAASAGDLVQVWETDPMRRVLTAELRGVAEDTVTIAIDAADTQKVDPTKEYRLVTLPVEDRPDREFASLLRAADETFSSVTVEAGSPLHGMALAALSLSVVSVKPDGETPMALPDPSTVLAPGDVVFAIARPDALRRLENAAKPLDPTLVSGPAPQRRARQTPDSAETSATADSGAATADDQPTQSTNDAGVAADTDPATATGESETTATGDPTASGSDDVATASGSDDVATASGSDDVATADTAQTETADESETTAAREFDPPAASDTDDSDDGATAGKADSSSFQQLKDEFDSGQADWADDEASDTVEASADTDSEVAFGDDAGEEPSTDTGESDVGGADDGLTDALGEASDDLDGLDIGDDSADDDLDFEDGDDELDDLGFGEDSGDDSALGDSAGSADEAGSTDEFGGDDLSFDDDEDDDLSSLSFDDGDEDDDLSSLDFDDDEDDGLTFEDEPTDEAESGDEGDSADEADDSDGDDADDSSGGGGASSFQQLKEEFESGEADWEDDISDSPGGDMRLDE